MAEDLLQEIACPNCRNPIDIRRHGRHVTCDACSSQFILEGHICPDCQTYHREERDFCSQCGQAMTRTCRKCHTSNWSGDEYCKQCGSALDIFELIHLHNSQATAERLDEQMATARQLKQAEEASSIRRMEEMMTQEHKRQEKIRLDLQKQREQEQRLLIFAFGGIGFFLILVILFVILF